MPGDCSYRKQHCASTDEQQAGIKVSRMSPSILIVSQGLERERRHIGGLLEDEGCLVFEVRSAEQALRLMERVCINLVLVCQDAVAVDELAERAWRLNPNTHFVVVGGAARAKTGWSDSYVRRPVTPAGLRERVLNLVFSSFSLGTAT